MFIFFLTGNWEKLYAGEKTLRRTRSQSLTLSYNINLKSMESLPMFLVKDNRTPETPSISSEFSFLCRNVRNFLNTCLTQLPRFTCIILNKGATGTFIINVGRLWVLRYAKRFISWLLVSSEIVMLVWEIFFISK